MAMVADMAATHQDLTWGSPRLTVTKTSVTAAAGLVADTVQDMEVVTVVMVPATVRATAGSGVDTAVAVFHAQVGLTYVKYSNLGYTVAWGNGRISL